MSDRLKTEHELAIRAHIISMNIGIFETEHFEGAYPVIKLFDTPENKLILFSDAPTYNRFSDLFKLQTNKYQWVIKNGASNRFAFFYQMYKAARKHKLDIFYFNTISNNHLLFGLLIKSLPGIRAIMTIHDINCLFDTKFSIRLRECLQHLGKRILLRQIHEFNVVSDTMIPYLQKKDTRIKVHNIPGAVFENRIRKSNLTEHIHLVVPGSIDNRRRDYGKVFELLNAAEETAVTLNITLLGGPHGQYGESVIARARQFKGRHTRLFCYEQKVVDQEEFDEKLDSAHFIFIPSVVNTSICRNIPEIYGITKSSGNIFDVIKHAKPFIVPQTLVVPADLRNSSFAYDSIIEVAEFLKKLLYSPDEYTTWHDKAVNNSNRYTIDKVREKNFLLFGSR